MSAYGLPIGGRSPGRHQSLRASGVQTLANITYPPAAWFPWTVQWCDSPFILTTAQPDTIYVTTPGRYSISILLAANVNANWRDLYIDQEIDGVVSYFMRRAGANNAPLWITKRNFYNFTAPTRLRFRLYQDSSATRTIDFAIFIAKLS